MQPGDLVRWKETGKITVYLGVFDGDIHRFHSTRWGYIDRWDGAFKRPIREIVEVISGARN